MTHYLVTELRHRLPAAIVTLNPADDGSVDDEINVLQSGRALALQIGGGYFSVTEWHEDEGALSCYGDFENPAEAVTRLCKQMEG